MKHQAHGLAPVGLFCRRAEGRKPPVTSNQPHGRYTNQKCGPSSRSASRTKQRFACGPGVRRCSRISSSWQPASSRAFARKGRSAKRRSLQRTRARLGTVRPLHDNQEGSSVCRTTLAMTSLMSDGERTPMSRRARLPSRKTSVIGTAINSSSRARSKGGSCKPSTLMEPKPIRREAQSVCSASMAFCFMAGPFQGPQNNKTAMRCVLRKPSRSGGAISTSGIGNSTGP